MIVPHSEEATYSIRLPLYIVQILVALLVLIVITFCVLGYAYLRAAALAEEASVLREVNRAQQEEINALALETQKMMDQMREVDELIDIVTEKLEVSPEELEEELETGDLGEEPDAEGLDDLQGQSTPGNPHTPSTGNSIYVDHDRVYGSRFTSGGIMDRAADNIAFLQSMVPERSETLDMVGGYVERTDAKPSIWPTRGRIVSGFGMRRIPYASSGYQFHNGVDIVGSHGAAIWATADGKVTYTGYRGSLGNLVIVDHGYGYETYYAHLAGFAVESGKEVKRGQTIGYMGSTGRTTGTHLHYEVHYEGSPVNPVNYMKQQ